MVIVSSHSIAISYPGDSGSRTTSGGAGEGEHRGASIQFRVQLEVDVTWDNNSTYIEVIVFRYDELDNFMLLGWGREWFKITSQANKLEL